MRYRIIETEARPRYRVWIHFEDGVEAEVDLSELVGQGVFKSWEDVRESEKVYIDPDSGTIAWPGGIAL
jgi:hypothetical protein